MRVRLLVLPLLLAACSPRPASAPSPVSAPSPASASPRTLPVVELRGLDGRPATLEALVGDKVALVSLWATWCTSCAAEFDALGRLSERAKGQGGVVVAVGVGEQVGVVARFVSAQGLKYPQLVDEEFRFADALGQKRVPTTLVLDRGRIVFTGGALDSRALGAFRSALDARGAAR